MTCLKRSMTYLQRGAAMRTRRAVWRSCLPAMYAQVRVVCGLGAFFDLASRCFALLPYSHHRLESIHVHVSFQVQTILRGAAVAFSRHLASPSHPILPTTLLPSQPSTFTSFQVNLPLPLGVRIKIPLLQCPPSPEAVGLSSPANSS